ncbi:MAG: hypothetical protein K6E59_02825 [Bacilli bacterium]|nr:hypothetical protein [Bacilli bacterium]
MGKASYENVLDGLRRSGIRIDSFRRRLFGVSLIGAYPFGGLELKIRLGFSSFAKTLVGEFYIPYSPTKGPLMDEYDRVFPEEKSMWGRSTPKFPKAIEDYMRGQGEGRNLAELIDHKQTLHVLVRVLVPVSGPQGFASGISKLSFEMRKGALHEDVLTHMFAV